MGSIKMLFCLKCIKYKHKIYKVRQFVTLNQCCNEQHEQKYSKAITPWLQIACYTILAITWDYFLPNSIEMKTSISIFDKKNLCGIVKSLVYCYCS